MRHGQMKAFVFLAIGALALSTAAALAQAPEVAPRSMFLNQKAQQVDGVDQIDDPVPVEPGIYCQPAHCKYYDGAFRDTRIWTHSTNISPQPIWIEVCSSGTGGREYYNHHELMPGDTLWVNNVIKRGEWGWIQLWTIVPELPDPDQTDPDLLGNQPSAMALTTNSSSLLEHPTKGLIRVNEVVGTTQFFTMNGKTPMTTDVSLKPGPGTPAWDVQTAHVKTDGGQQDLEVWSSNQDPRLNRLIRSETIKTPRGKMLIAERDRDGDGLVDATTKMEYIKFDDGKTVILTVEKGGAVTYHRTFTKRFLDNGREVIRMKEDQDGDGSIDATALHKIRQRGDTRITRIYRDQDADGSYDEVEVKRFVSRGFRDTLSVTEIRDAAGDLKEKIRVELTPAEEGFRVVVFHDEDGDGRFDSREIQDSKMGPLGGTDVDVFSIDLGNDGTIDSVHKTVTHKNFDGTRYVERMESDVWGDGSVDAVTQRKVSFRDEGGEDRPDVPATVRPDRP